MAHYNDIIVEFPYVYYNGKAIDTDCFIPFIKQKGKYAGELEANILTKILDINILIFEFNIDNDNINYYSFCNYYGILNPDIYNGK